MVGHLDHRGESAPHDSVAAGECADQRPQSARCRRGVGQRGCNGRPDSPPAVQCTDRRLPPRRPPTGLESRATPATSRVARAAAQPAVALAAPRPTTRASLDNPRRRVLIRPTGHRDRPPSAVPASPDRSTVARTVPTARPRPDRLHDPAAARRESRATAAPRPRRPMRATRPPFPQPQPCRPAPSGAAPAESRRPMPEATGTCTIRARLRRDSTAIARRSPRQRPTHTPREAPTTHAPVQSRRAPAHPRAESAPSRSRPTLPATRARARC